MPVFFYLDPDLLNDLNMKGVETVTLNYTFFSKYLVLHMIVHQFFLGAVTDVLPTEARYDNNGRFKAPGAL